MALYAIPTENGLQTTLASTLSSSETGSLTLADNWASQLASVSASRPGILVINRVDANGVDTSSSREYIKFTSVSGTTISTLTRGQGGSIAKAHSAGSIVELVVDADTLKSIADTIVVEHDTDGTHTAITATSITLASGATPNEFSTDGTMAGNSDSAVPTEKAVKTYVDAEVAGVSLSGITNLARAYQSSQQTNLTTGTWTKINLQTETYDTGNNFDSTTSYRYTAPSNGYYQVNAVVGFINVVANKSYAAGIREGGSTFKCYQWSHSDNTGQVSCHVSDIIYLTAGQYIELMAQVVGDSTVDILNDQIATYMSVAYLGAGS